MDPADLHLPDQSGITIRSELERSGVLSDDIWEEARIFLAAAKAGTIAGAARSLRVSTLTISRSVRRLQDRLGSTLFISSNRGITLTHKGEEFVNVLMNVDKQLYSAAAELRTESLEPKGVVRVSITEGLAVVFLASAIREFEKVYPEIEIHIKAPVSADSLRTNQTDVMIGFMYDQSAKVSRRSLGTNFLVPCAGLSYIERYGEPTIADIAGHQFVDSEQYSRSSPIWSSWHQLVDQGRCRHYADTSMVYAMMVREGIGIGLLSNFATTDDRIVAVDLPAVARIRLYATALTERLASKPVRTVFDFLTDLYGPRNPWFAQTGDAGHELDRHVQPAMFRFGG